MDKQELLRKISSRKFWAMVAGLATSTGLVVGLNGNEIVQMVAIIGGFGSIVTYIFCEAYVDGKSTK
jgi:hypothetical protein